MNNVGFSTFEVTGRILGTEITHFSVPIFAGLKIWYRNNAISMPKNLAGSPKSAKSPILPTTDRCVVMVFHVHA